MSAELNVVTAAEWGQMTPLRGVSAPAAREAEALDLMYNLSGRPSFEAEYRLRKEATSSSDFPILTGFITNRQLLARWRDTPHEWDAYVSRDTVGNFNIGERIDRSGIQKELSKVSEFGSRKPLYETEGKYTVSIATYGGYHAISWKAQINDIMRAFQDLPTLMLDSALKTESMAVTRALATSSGPNSALFGDTVQDTLKDAAGSTIGTTVDNLITGALSVTSLKEAITKLRKQTSHGGKTMNLQPKALVIPPDLEFTARAILDSLMLAPSGGPTNAASVLYPTINPLASYKSSIQLIINPELPEINTTNGTTAWYLFADPAKCPAIEVTHLAGNDTPSVFMKAPNKLSLAGTSLGVAAGDFYTDATEYAVGYTFGVNILNPRGAIASTGAS
jgi:hypothetical protein